MVRLQQQVRSIALQPPAFRGEEPESPRSYGASAFPLFLVGVECPTLHFIILLNLFFQPIKISELSKVFNPK